MPTVSKQPSRIGGQSTLCTGVIAERQVSPVPPPKLVVFAGPPCSGKSTLAATIACELGVNHLQMDQVRHRLMPEAGHCQATIDIAYRAMHLAAELFLRRAHTVIVDATYGRASQRLELESIAKSTGASVFLNQCRISAEAAVDRFRRRKAHHLAVDLTPRRVRLLAQNYPYSQLGLVIQSTTNLAEILASIRQYLRCGQPTPLGEWPILPHEGPAWPGPAPSAKAIAWDFEPDLA